MSIKILASVTWLTMFRNLNCAKVDLNIIITILLLYTKTWPI